jgi:hypothetical protein
MVHTSKLAEKKKKKKKNDEHLIYYPRKFLLVLLNCAIIARLMINECPKTGSVLLLQYFHQDLENIQFLIPGLITKQLRIIQTPPEKTCEYCVII